MGFARHTINELLVGLFNYILYIEERNLKKHGVNVSMTEVHLLESIKKASNNTMSHIAKRSMITQGSLTTSVKKLEEKGYVERYKDPKDGRIVRLRVTDKADNVLAIHDEFHRYMIDKAIADLNLEDNDVLVNSLDNILKYFREEYALEMDPE
ncbi:MAG: MarR family transcriptional regulator [Erysipelotrichaceae bacterium]|nr:MarR family transcriptional regulator [Erysipelotrichaceae bacterium]